MINTTFGIELVVVRHGETEWNRQKRAQGHKDIELNAAGIEQARRAAMILQNEKFDAVYTSDLKRANDTGKIIVKQLNAVPSGGFFKDKRIREKSFGNLEGMHFDDAAMKEALLQGNLGQANGAESQEDFQKKVVSFLHDLNKKHSEGDKILIATHGGVVRTFFNKAGRKGFVEVKNGSISRFLLSPQGKLQSFESAQALPLATRPG
jgi:2,3-bisphosphoglycerate-dependent phosphoglycerate mutase